MSSYRRKNPFKKVPSQIIIAVEGDTEGIYYTKMAEVAPQFIKVQVLAPKNELDKNGNFIDKDGMVKPGHLHGRLRRYCEKAKNNVQPDDQIWVVMDADKFHKHYEVKEFLEAFLSDKDLKVETRVLVRSNPCFEIWKHLHLQDIPVDTKFGSCEPVGKLVGKLENGHGFDCEKHTTQEYIDAAIARAEKLTPDAAPNMIHMNSPGTSLHLLAKELQALIKLQKEQY